MKIGNQEIEVATTPHMGDWMSIAYLPDGTVVAGARADTQAMAEKDLYDKLADRFKPRFDPTRTYEAIEPDFDADEYMTSPNPLGPFGDLLGYLRDGNLELSGNVARFSHHCVHERSTSVEMVILGIYDEAGAVGKMVESLICKLEEDIKTRMVDWNRKIYEELEHAYDYAVSEEVVAENIMANGTVFDENGGQDGDCEYTYDQLSDEAKETARDWWIEGDAGDTFWAEPVIDEWKELLQNHGFNDVVISYSGFSSQGDGASFTCKWIDFEKYITTPDPLTIPEQERGNRVAEAVNTLLEDDPDFDADEYMSSDDSPEEAILRELRFKLDTRDGRISTVWKRTEGAISIDVKRMEIGAHEWFVWGYVLDMDSPNGQTWKRAASEMYDPALGNLAEVIQDVEVACRFYGESVEEPDFDADDYMSLAPDQQLVQDLGFKEIERMGQVRQYVLDLSAVSQLLLKNYEDNWVVAHTLIDYRFHKTTSENVGTWSPGCQGTLKDMLDKVIAKHKPVQEAVEPDFDADAYMSIDSPSGLVFDEYLERKGFQYLHRNSYSKEYRNLNVSVHIFVSTLMDVDGERDGSIFVEAKEATDYYQDHSSVFWKTWHLANPPEDAVNEVCELASNPNGTLGWLRDAYKQYRERLGESSVQEAVEPDFDADAYMSATSSEDDLKRNLLANGFEGRDFATGFRLVSDRTGSDHRYTVWYSQQTKHWHLDIDERAQGRADVKWRMFNQWSSSNLAEFITWLKSVQLVTL